MKTEFNSTFEYKLIYIFRINDGKHDNLLKIGDATIHSNKSPSELCENCSDLNRSAKKRINEYTTTAGIVYDLLHTEIAIYKIDNKVKAFRDYKVHEVLMRSGIKHHYFDTVKKQNEWFKVDLKTAVQCIKAVKAGHKSLTASEITTGNDPIVFRPEQLDAIKATISQFKKNDRMLWNAKMRFGKTLSALEVANRMNFKKTIIITHRPAVNVDWFEDFNKIFNSRNDFKFGSKLDGYGESLDTLLNSEENFVYFASMQDLRESKTIGGKFDKNNKIFETNWDFVVVDEAHEGTKTDLGATVLNRVIKPENNYPTKELELSGTPFNLIMDFKKEEIFTWDYIMEQRAKSDWEQSHYGDTNPYDGLAQMNIFTYYLDKSIPGYMDLEDKAFNFREFFRTWTGDISIDRKRKPLDCKISDFVHKEDVKNFLNMITKKDDKSNYPYSTCEYRDYFRHSLWMVPGVKEAKALSILLKEHPVFGQFNIANVAGDGDEEKEEHNARKLVEDAIGENPDSSYSITISCGKLTTGVTIKPWTAVFMLSGSYSTSASSYLQTIFRVQSPANINGKIKEKCYVFDFAPDRTLKMVAEAVQFSTKVGKTNSTNKKLMGEFLNFCPVISISNTGMEEYDVSGLLQQLKRAYAERAVKNGFDDPCIYNDNLLKLDELSLGEFKELKGIIGSSKVQKKTGDIDINDQGFTEEEYEKIEQIRKKPKNSLSPEEIKKLEELRNNQKQKHNAISILRGISIRIPLLMYGVNIDSEEDVSAKRLPDLVDDISWKEFMPAGVTKQLYLKFAKYYDQDIFISAGKRIRSVAVSADTLDPEERVKRISELFATFKNPDKETILTPWKVVNRQMSDCLGGYDFFDEEHYEKIDEPRFVDRGIVTQNTFCKKDVKILEINSKTGLYPLYVAFSIYKNDCMNDNTGDLTFDKKLEIWEHVITNNIFVVCKTEMAKHITKRTLIGFRKVKTNIHFFKNLINQLVQTKKSENFVSKMHDGIYYWKGTFDKNMKFEAIVGNPPYQMMDNGAMASAKPVYQYFVDVAKKINPDYICMIMPSRWFAGGKGLDTFRKSMLHDDHIRIIHDFPIGADCFPGTRIAGGVCYFLWDKNTRGDCKVITHNDGEANSEMTRPLLEDGAETFIRINEAISILRKVKQYEEESFSNIVSSRKPFGLATDFFKDPQKYNLPAVSENFIVGGITIVGTYKYKTVTRYVPMDYPFVSGKRNIKKYKVYVSQVLDNGFDWKKEKLKPFLGRPFTACTETFLCVGPFENESEAMNAISYMNTKLFHLLMFLKKVSHHVTNKVYEFVPLQKFDEPWNDSKIYSKYGLTSKEINFIESNIK